MLKRIGRTLRHTLQIISLPIVRRINRTERHTYLSDGIGILPTRTPRHTPPRAILRKRPTGTGSHTRPRSRISEGIPVGRAAAYAALGFVRAVQVGGARAGGYARPGGAVGVQERFAGAGAHAAGRCGVREGGVCAAALEAEAVDRVRGEVGGWAGANAVEGWAAVVVGV